MNRSSGREGVAAEALRLGQARFPGIQVSPPGLRDFVTALPTDDERVRQHAEDIFLAFACASGALGAAEALEQTQFVQVPSYIRRYGAEPEFIDEVMQRLRCKLLLDEPPKIASYSGAGPLGAWVRITAARIAIDRASAQDNSVPVDDAPLDASIGGADPELETLRRRYGPALQEALRRAIDALSPENRILLWLHYGQHLNIDRIGDIYGAHRATVARWLSALRSELLDDVRARFRQDWPVSDSEFHSLYRAIEQDLRISLRQLRTTPSDDDLANGLVARTPASARFSQGD